MVVLIAMGVVPSPTTMWVAMADWRCQYLSLLTPWVEEEANQRYL